jgi:hypothetical protein
VTDDRAAPPIAAHRPNGVWSAAGRVTERKEPSMSAQGITFGENLLRMVFGILLCAGYVYVVFFFFFMFRTVFWPAYFGG